MISVIVPIYNVEKYLQQCIDSILIQTYTDLEIILVDDGSTDDCSNICDRYEQIDPRINVIHKENGGLSSARNIGIKASRGEYLAFVDSDDYILPDMYEKMLKALNDSDSDVVMCNYYRFFEKDNKLIKANLSYCCDSGESFLKTNILDDSYAWNKLYRKELFEDICFPVGKYFEDVFIMHNIFLKARKVMVIPDALYVYRRRDNSISSCMSSYYRIDFLEAVVAKLRFLIGLGAGENVIFYHCMQIYSIWKHFYNSDKRRDELVVAGWKKYYREFRRITKGISKGWKLYHKFRLVLVRIHPMIYRLVWGGFHRAGSIVKKFLQHLLGEKGKYMLSGMKVFLKNRSLNKLIPTSVYNAEFRKYLKYLKMDANKPNINAQMREFLTADFVLKSDRLQLSDDPTDPVVVVVVRNELARMQLFFEHYRKLGIHQFAVLDNGSEDGTLEYLVGQDGTRVYQILEEYRSSRREAWCEKLLAQIGYNRWYILVDSDELLDYVGSEQHSIQEMIQKMEEYGNKRALGYMLDMYSKEPLFAPLRENLSISNYLEFFDPEGYYVSLQDEPELPIIKDVIYGGPRYRKFGVKSWLSKQAVFFFDKNTLYRCSHYIYPQMGFVDIPVLYVLRHYKYLSLDKEEYERRIKREIFAGNSSEYKVIMGKIGVAEVTLFYEESKRYENSMSLRGLPYLEEINW